jgi:hypothetical protein
LIATLPNDIIPGDVLQELNTLLRTNTLERAVAIIRSLVPTGYELHPYCKGIVESLLDMLLSVVAIYMLRKYIVDFKSVGVNFSTHLYVPETDKITGDTIQEWGELIS